MDVYRIIDQDDQSVPPFAAQHRDATIVYHGSTTYFLESILKHGGTAQHQPFPSADLQRLHGLAECLVPYASRDFERHLLDVEFFGLRSPRGQGLTTRRAFFAADFGEARKY